jgi:hypothetical protein
VTEKKPEEHAHDHEHGAGFEHDHPSPFLMLIGGLAGQAHVGLGLREDPISHTTEKHLPSARQAIDLLAMLEAKTKGNLEPDESRLLGAVLADLRLAFVRLSK